MSVTQPTIWRSSNPYQSAFDWTLMSSCPAKAALRTPLPNLFDFGRPCARRPASARLRRQSDNSFQTLFAPGGIFPAP
jgi:hypothetical protein